MKAFLFLVIFAVIGSAFYLIPSFVQWDPVIHDWVIARFLFLISGVISFFLCVGVEDAYNNETDDQPEEIKSSSDDQPEENKD